MARDNAVSRLSRPNPRPQRPTVPAIDGPQNTVESEQAPETQPEQAPEQAPDAPAGDADLSAEMNAYADDAQRDQQERDDSDPFGAALGHAILEKKAKTFTRAPRFKVETIPASIRRFVDQGIEDYAATEVDGIAFKANTPKYKFVPFATAEDAQKFIKFAKKYGLYRPAGKVSVRAYIVKDKPETVRVAVTPYATRKKKETATDVQPEPAAETKPETAETAGAQPENAPEF